MFNFIKMYFKQLIEIATQKIESMNQAELERVKACNEAERKQTEFLYSINLRKRWALALNNLPNHLRVSNTEIYSDYLSNELLDYCWQIKIPIAKELDTIECKKLKKSLIEILINQSNEGHQYFQTRFHQDSYEYAYEKMRLEQDKSTGINDGWLLYKYQQLIDTHYFKLIDINILHLYSTDNVLFIQYAINEERCLRYDFNNYRRYVTH